MSWKCDIVTDLAPLYHDGVASAASKKLVKEHLRECPECRAFYKKYSPVEGIKMDMPVSDAQDFVQLAQQMRRRRVLLWIGFLAYVGATMGTWLLHRIHKDM